MNNLYLARLGKLWLALILFFLYAPIAVMAFMSFNASQYYQLPFDFSLKWYEKLAANQEIIDAATRSILIAMIIGFVFFGDVPTAQMLIGSGIVILSGVLIIWRERALGLKRGKDRSTLTPQG